MNLIDRAFEIVLFVILKWQYSFMILMVSAVQAFTAEKLKNLLVQKLNTDEYLGSVVIVVFMGCIITFTFAANFITGLAKVTFKRERFNARKFVQSPFLLAVSLFIIILLFAFQTGAYFAGFNLMVYTISLFMFFFTTLFAFWEMESVGENLEILTGKRVKWLKFITLISKQAEKLFSKKITSMKMCEDMPDKEEDKFD